MTATMLGRQVSSLLRQPLQARLAAATSSQCLCMRTLSTSSPFGGAAASTPASKPGRPKKAVGEPSRPVKRAVKRAAKTSASDASEPAAEKVAAKKKTAATKKTKAAKTKAAKTKVAKPKPKPKPARRETTPEQLARVKEKRTKLELKELKAAALSPPKLGHFSAYLQFVKAKVPELKEKLDQGSAQGEKNSAILSEHSKGIAAAWKECSPADIEHYNHLSHTAKEANRAEYKRWIEAHTPDEINVANQARSTLRRRENRTKKSFTKWPHLMDERRVPRTTNSYVQFNVNRQASGDFANIALAQRAKLISQEWKALDAEEKEKYRNLAKADSKRYIDEHKTVYGYAPLHTELPAASQQAVAA